MKKYIKPNVRVVAIKTQHLLESNSITTVTGANGIGRGSGDFGGGAADSRRRGYWDDDEYEY